MKRCPECRRDYYDDTLIYCLDDGNSLLDGPGSASEAATVNIESKPSDEEPRTLDLPVGGNAHRTGDIERPIFRKRLFWIVSLTSALIVLCLGVLIVYKSYPKNVQPTISSVAVLPLDNLSVSPQCGFASTMEGNLLSEQDQWRKLQLVVDTARKVWAHA